MAGILCTLHFTMSSSNDSCNEKIFNCTYSPLDARYIKLQGTLPIVLQERKQKRIHRVQGPLQQQLLLHR